MMPTYLFQCNKCNSSFETIKKIVNRYEPLDDPCPNCGEVGGIESIVTAPAFSYSAERLPVNGKLREKFQQIHENTPGSRLNTVSSITKI